MHSVVCVTRPVRSDAPSQRGGAAWAADCSGPDDPLYREGAEQETGETALRNVNPGPTGRKSGETALRKSRPAVYRVSRKSANLRT